MRLSQTIYDLIKGWEEILFDKTRQLSHLGHSYVWSLSISESGDGKIPLTVLEV